MQNRKPMNNNNNKKSDIEMKITFSFKPMFFVCVCWVLTTENQRLSRAVNETFEIFQHGHSFKEQSATEFQILFENIRYQHTHIVQHRTLLKVYIVELAHLNLFSRSNSLSDTINLTKFVHFILWTTEIVKFLLEVLSFSVVVFFFYSFIRCWKNGLGL